MIELAHETGGEAHGFRFIQLPINLAMPEALTLRNQIVNGRELSVLDAAATMNVTVVSSASMLQGRVARGLPETIRQPLGSLASDAQTAIQFVRSVPGVTTALVGMSSSEHVEENLQIAGIEPLGEAEFLKAFGD
jgi:predicted aldo/keto reductase-like oxidoreductase